MRKQTMWFSNRSNTNQAVQSGNIARSLKFRSGKKRNCTIQVAKTKVFVFAYAKCWFSHDAAQIESISALMHTTLKQILQWIKY